MEGRGSCSVVAEADQEGRPGEGAGGRGGGPLVVACLAPSDPRPEVDPLTGEVGVDPRRSDLTAADAAALEHARRIADAWGGRLVAVAAGSASADGALRRAAALGASVWRVPWGAAAGEERLTAGERPASRALDGPALVGDQMARARRLAAVIARLGPPDLVVCGDRSALGGTGALPALLAHYLGFPQALGLVSLEVDGSAVMAERRLDGGWRERLRLTTPAVCSVEAAGVRLRRASLAGELDAARAPIPTVVGGVGSGGSGVVGSGVVGSGVVGSGVVGSGVVGSGVVGPGVAGGEPPPVRWHVGAPRPYRPRTKLVPPPEGSTHERLLALTGALVAHDPPRLVGPIDADGAVDELLDLLGRHGYLDRPGEGASP
jgi:electron transfer flavoprotein beta subunit